MILSQIAYQFFDPWATLSQWVTNISWDLLPIGIVVFNTRRQIETIPLENILSETCCKLQTVANRAQHYQNMIARDIAFVGTDIDRKHDSNSVVMNVGLRH